MKKETVITIVSDDKPSTETKYPVRPSKRSKGLARRLSFPAITFYDLASINTGTAESPVYTDHSIVKVPDYSVVAQLNDLSLFIGATVNIDGLVTADYATQTARYFDVAPVTEWKHYFRKLELEINPGDLPTIIGAPASYPANLMVRYAPQTGSPNFLEIFGNLSVDISTPAGRTARAINFTNYGAAWDSRGLEYRNFTELRLKPSTTAAFPFYAATFEWFSMSTVLKDILQYKITATYNPTAADVGALTITGNIDVYLIPQIGLFMAASYLGTEDVPVHFPYDGENGMQLLGPWYQVLPRAHWPGYVDPYILGDQDALSETFLAYQQGRTDAIASTWTRDAGLLTITTGALDAVDFRTGNNSWKCFIDNGSDQFAFYSTGTAQTFRSITGATSDDPILMAVIKLHGKFYYVWSKADPDFPDQNTATDETDSVFGYDRVVYPTGDESP